MAKESKKANPNSHSIYLTEAEDNFVRDVFEGRDRVLAFKDYFDTSEMDEDKIKERARLMLARPKIRNHYNTLFKEMQERLAEASVYTFEQGVHTLKYLIDAVQVQLEDKKNARDTELEFLFDELETAKTDSQRKRVIGDINKAGRRMIITTPESLALSTAIAELNKMHGFNEENVNMNTAVVFESGELSDEPLSQEKVNEILGVNEEE